MKTLFVGNLCKECELEGQEVVLYGWISGDRKTKNYRFLDLVDSTGTIQVVVEGGIKIDGRVTQEVSVEVKGLLRKSPINGQMEILASEVNLIGEVSKTLSPSPRDDFNVFDPKYADYVLKNRHLFIRNEKLMAALKARHLVMGAIHSWFRENGFTEITAPVLTPILLYEPETGIPVSVNNEHIFLTQCVAFYLESAVHAFEKVYNLGPSFRGKESISKRHLTEYWHVKAEVAFTDIDGIISIVESLVSYVVNVCEK
jgi:asparaginyl-tRNA synthetase